MSDRVLSAPDTVSEHASVWPALEESGFSTMTAPDADLAALSREGLVQEVMRLRAGIRRHRDSTGHELCWHHPHLWRLLPEATDPLPSVPEWPAFL